MRHGAYQIQEFRDNWDFDAAQGHSNVNTQFIQKMSRGLTLNVCCGTDHSGNVRVDVDKRFLPDVIADLRHLPFRDDVFDTVICDPPFQMFNKFAWKDELARVAKKRVILSAPNINIRMKSCWKRQLWFTDAGTPYLRLWHVFDRQDDLKSALAQ